STIRLRLHLLPALQQHLPLERADPIDEEDAVQVVDLVLERTGQEPLGLDPDGPAVPVQPLDDDAGRALDDLLQLRDADPPLSVSLVLVARLEDDRIHEAERLDPRLPDIDDDDAAADPDLRRGEADAVRVVHRREHLVHQAPDLVVDLLDRLGLLPQDRVAEDPYLVYRHAAYDFASCVKTRAILPRATTMRDSPLFNVTRSSARWTTSPRIPPSVMTWSPRFIAASISWCRCCSLRCGRISRK